MHRLFQPRIIYEVVQSEILHLLYMFKCNVLGFIFSPPEISFVGHGSIKIVEKREGCSTYLGSSLCIHISDFFFY